MTNAEEKLERAKYAADLGRASYTWEARVADLVVRAEFDVFGKEHPLSELHGLEPYFFHAVPYRPDKFKAAFIEIEAGMKPIWEHIVTTSINLFVPGPQQTIECLCFGREHPDGREEVMLVLPSGDSAGFASRAEARKAFWDAVNSYPSVATDGRIRK
jgi:hypothetical protein